MLIVVESEVEIFYGNELSSRAKRVCIQLAPEDVRFEHFYPRSRSLVQMVSLPQFASTRVRG